MSKHNHDHEEHDEHSADDFDEFYAAGQQWSGEPNSTLVREAADLTTGTALDIGCGEGADVAWLAEQGWTVTGIDPSAHAIDRSHQIAESRHLLDRVDFGVGGIEAVEGKQFDLVIGFYVPLAADDSTSVPAIEKLVAPGGTLLWVHHVGHFRPVLTPAEFAEQLQELSMSKLENIKRFVEEGAGRHHKDDQVLVARRK